MRRMSCLRAITRRGWSADMRVQVYKNLRTGLWSVCVPAGPNTRGRVIAHVAEIALTDCRMVVREAQRQYVLRKRERAVHAWVEGEWSGRSGNSVGSAPSSPPTRARAFSYNPYRCGHFYSGDARVDSAAQVWFTSEGKAYFHG